jgi:hypothetical protein
MMDDIQKRVGAGIRSASSSRDNHVYSGVIPAALIIGHHLAISALCRAARASGVCCSGGGASWTISAYRLITDGLPKAETTAELSLATMSRGVPLGTQSACQIGI